MAAISEIVEKLLPELVADPWAGSAAARAVMELGPRGIQALLRTLGTAPGDTQARGLFVVDGLLLEFHASRLMEQRTQVVLDEATSPSQALIRISDQLGMDIELAAAPLSETPLLPPGRFALAELLDTITLAMPGWTWKQDSKGRIFLKAGRRPALPGVHAGPFHIQVRSVAMTRRWDATGLSGHTELQLSLSIEQPLQKLVVPTLALQRIEEDNGQQHELRSTRARMRSADEVLHATFPGPQARTQRLRALLGQVTGKFPIGYDQCELTDLQPGAVIATLNGPICVEQVTPQGCMLRFTPSASDRALESGDAPEGVGLSLLMLGFDRQNRAAIGRIKRFSSYSAGSDSSGPPSVVWNVSFHDPGFQDFGPLHRLRYRTITKLAELSYPFCLRDVPIP